MLIILTLFILLIIAVMVLSAVGIGALTLILPFADIIIAILIIWMIIKHFVKKNE